LFYEIQKNLEDLILQIYSRYVSGLVML